MKLLKICVNSVVAVGAMLCATSAFAGDITPQAVAELYNLQVFQGEFAAEPREQQLVSVTQVQIGKPFSSWRENAYSTAKKADSNVKAAFQNSLAYGVEGTLHPPKNGKYTLDYSISESDSQSGYGLRNGGTLDLELGKSVQRTTIAGVARGFRVLLTKADEPSTEATSLAGNKFYAGEVFWGKPEKGLQLGIVPSYSLTNQGIRKLAYILGRTANFQLLLRNVSDKPVILPPLLSMHLGIPIVRDEAGNPLGISTPVYDGPFIRFIKNRTLAPSEILTLEKQNMHIGSTKSNGIVSILDCPAGKYRLRYKTRLDVEIDNNRESVELVSGEIDSETTAGDGLLSW
jgi:hypothetical protein